MNKQAYSFDQSNSVDF